MGHPPQVGLAAIAAEGDEMIVAFGLVTLQAARHEVIVASNIL